MTGRSTSRRARFLVVGVLVVMAVFAGVLVGRMSGVDTPDRVRADARAPAAKPSRATARDTAVSYLAALRWNVVVDDRRRLAAIQRFAEPGAAARLESALVGSVEPIRAAVMAPPVVARRVVLGYRIDRFSAVEASVSVWGMVLFATRTYGPSTQWATSRVDLTWRGDRWTVSAIHSRGGPSPDSSLPALAAADRSFTEIDSAP